MTPCMMGSCQVVSRFITNMKHHKTIVNYRTVTEPWVNHYMTHRAGGFACVRTFVTVKKVTLVKVYTGQNSLDQGMLRFVGES